MSKLRFIDFCSRYILFFFFVPDIHRGGWPNIALGAPKPYPGPVLVGLASYIFTLRDFAFWIFCTILLCGVVKR